MKKAIIVVVVLAVLGATGWAVAAKLRSGPDEAQPTTVRAEPVAAGDLIETVSAPGKVEPKNKVSISARLSARIAEMPHEEGQRVTKGDPTATPPTSASLLVKLDANDLLAQLRGSEARYAAQEAQITVSEARMAAQEAQISASRVMLDEAERDLRRQQELLGSRDVSQAIVDAAQAKFDQLQAQLSSAQRQLDADRAGLVVLKHELEAADAEIARSRDMLSYTTITSPIDGVITKINAQVGELVMTGTMNNRGTVIMEVADLSQMIVNAQVDETSIANVQVGQAAKVYCEAFTDEPFDGVVKSVALTVSDEQDQASSGMTGGSGSPYYKTEVLIDAKGRPIRAGLTADVEIQTKKHANAIRVPSQSVLGRPLDSVPQEMRDRPEVDKNRATATVVYRLVDGKAVITPVKVGPSDISHTMIESGLKPGDVVITGPYKVLETIQHDAAVKLEQPATAPATQDT